MRETKTDKKTLEEKVLKIVRDAGQRIKENAYNLEYVEWKKFDDPVTDLDRKTEQYIKDSLREYHINFVGEEYGKDDNNSDITAYIDPIDGTKSFMRKEFLSTVSIALAGTNDTTFGVVYDFMRDIMFYASEKSCVVVENKTYDIPLDIPSALPTLSIDDNASEISKKFEGSKYHIRTPVGSVALNLAQLAQGSYDGIIMAMKKGGPHDIAAGYHILKQAGFNIYDFDHNKFDFRHPNNGLIAIKPEYENDVMKIMARDKND
jgi:fructose-1,6-bisphosphatase/inositol monophosphatase family enzyme